MKKAYYGLLTEDKALCLSSGIVCVLMIAFVIIKSIKNRKQTDLKNDIDNEEKFVKHSDS